MSIRKTVDVFRQFGSDVLSIILLYVDELELVLILQNLCPRALKHIMITANALSRVKARNYRFVRKLDIENATRLSKNMLKNFPDLEELYCSGCIQIDDEILQHLPKLTALSCRGCYPITDLGLPLLLTTLDCSNCFRITDRGIRQLTLLTVLICRGCPKITNQSIWDGV